MKEIFLSSSPSDDILSGKTGGATESAIAGGANPEDHRTYSPTLPYSRLTEIWNIGFSMLGAWALYAQVCVLAQTDFSTLKRFSVLPFLVILLVFRAFKTPAGLSAAPNPIHKAASQSFSMPLWFRLGGPILATATYFATDSTWLFWVFAVVYLASESLTDRSQSRQSILHNSRVSRGEVVGLIAIAALAVLITSGASRPNKDDAYYLNVAVSAITQPDIPLLTADTLHRSGLPPIEQTLHLLQVYELLIAVLADTTGAPVQIIYYLIFPALWAVLGTVIHWILLRRFLTKGPALFGLLMAVIILILWGDGHWTIGNFAFVRLFQGKAVFIMVALPALVHSAWSFQDSPSLRNWIHLVLVQCAAVALTINGLVIAPLAVVVAVISGVRFSKVSIRELSYALAASFPLILLAFGMYRRLQLYRHSLGATSSSLDFEHLLGASLAQFAINRSLGSVRPGLVILLLMFLPVLAKLANIRLQRRLANYVLGGVTIFFFPASALVSAQFVTILNWRIFWAFPFALLLGLGAGLLAGNRLPHRLMRSGMLALWILGFAIIGPITIPKEIWSWRNIGKFKVHQSNYEVARYILDNAPREGLALVPEGIAVYLLSSPDGPPLIASRIVYLISLGRKIPARDLENRIALLKFIRGKRGNLAPAMALELIDSYSITTIAYAKGHKFAEYLDSELTAKSFALSEFNDHIVGVRNCSDAGTEILANPNIEVSPETICRNAPDDYSQSLNVPKSL